MRRLGPGPEAATLAAQQYQRAQQSYQATTFQLASSPANTPAEVAIQAQAEQNAGDALQSAYSTAGGACEPAVMAATEAAQACASTLTHISDPAKATALHQFLDLLGAPGTVLGGLDVVSQLRTGEKIWSLLHAMSTGDWGALEKVELKAYAAVVADAKRFGPDSGGALAAQFMYESIVSGNAFGDIVDAGDPLKGPRRGSRGHGSARQYWPGGERRVGRRYPPRRSVLRQGQGWRPPAWWAPEW